jgi:PAS domain S-box-containing protein
MPSDDGVIWRAARAASAPDFSPAHSPEWQLIYDTAPIGLAVLSPDCRYLQINQRLTDICGLPVADHIGRSVRETVPALAGAVEDIVRSIMETGEPVTGIEVAGQRRDESGERFWVTYWHPLRSRNGEIIGVNVAAEEITERKRSEAALLASERQFHTLADSIPQLVWMAEADGSIFWANSRCHAYTGVPVGGLYGRRWMDILDPAESDAAFRWATCLDTGSALEAELKLRARDGHYVPFLTRVVPLKNSSGAVYRWIGTHIDISEQKDREEQTRFIADELSHRTKNLLTVVLAVANQTARHATDVAQYQERFSERLIALANCHDLLARDQWQGATFGDLLTVQMKPFRESTEAQIETNGPPIILQPEAVHYLGLAFHELATNASKHGALSVPRGVVSISWLLDDAADTVCVSWAESGGPRVLPPQRKGFGHVVIDRIVPRALKGTGRMSFLPDGVNWAFEFPLTRDKK